MVSIIVPIYNIAPYIERCVDSVLSQTYDNWELILVDDGSIDGSSVVCDEQAKKDERIKVIHQINSGAAAARKQGVSVSSGEWIMFVDGDDTITKDALEHLLSFDNGNYDIIGAVWTRIESQRTFVRKVDVKGILSVEDYICALLLNQTVAGPIAKLIRKDLFTYIDWETPKFVIQNEDLLMLIHLSCQAKQIYMSEYSIYNYICRSSSASQSQTMSLRGWKYIFDVIHKLVYSYQSDKIKYAYLHYRLIRFRDNIIKKGLFLEQDDDAMAIVIKDSSSTINLTNEDLYILTLLKKSRKRRIFYLKYRIKRIVKKNIKRILNK